MINTPIDPQRHYLMQVEQAAENTRQSLREVQARVQRSLDTMAEGGRPGTTRDLLGQPVRDAEHYSARLTALLDLAGPMGVSEEDLLTAYNNGAS